MIWNKKTKKYVSEDTYFCCREIGLLDSNKQPIHEYDIVRIEDTIYHVILKDFCFVYLDKLTNKTRKIIENETIFVIGNGIE